MNLIKFVNKINKEQAIPRDYNFYMVVDEEEYEIIPVYAMLTDQLVELILKEDGDNINNSFNVIDIVNADYYMEKVEK